MHTDLAVTAAFRFDKTANDAIASPAALALGRIADLLDEMREQACVFFAPEQHAIRGKAIAPSASRLLVILLDGFRQREVDYGADGSFVDA